MKKSSIIKNLIFSIIIIVLFFSLPEIIVRLKYYRETKDETFLFWGQTDIELILSKYLRKGDVEKKFNGDSDEKYEIAVFGGSTAYSWFVPREFAWSQILQQLLNKKLERKVIVFNCGEGGSSSTKDVTRMRSFLTKHSPDMIIFYVGVNDRTNILAAKVNNRYYLEDEVGFTFIQRLDAKLMKLSLFYTAIKEKYNKIVMHDIHRAYQRKKKDIRLIKIEEAGLKRYEKNLVEALEICKKLNIKLVLGTVPLVEKDNYYEKLLEMMRKIAIEFNLSIIDVAKEFDNMEDEEKKLLFVPDVIHLNKNGTSKVAKIIYSYLIKNERL